MTFIRNSLIILLITLSFDVSSQITNYINNLNGPVKKITETSESFIYTKSIESDSGFYKRTVFLNEEDRVFVVRYTIVKEYSKAGLLQSKISYLFKLFNDCLSYPYHHSHPFLSDSCIVEKNFKYTLDGNDRISKVFINQSNIHHFSVEVADTLQSSGVYLTNDLRVVDEWRFKNIIKYLPEYYTIKQLYTKKKDLIWKRKYSSYFNLFNTNIPPHSSLYRCLERNLPFISHLKFTNNHKVIINESKYVGHDSYGNFMFDGKGNIIEINNYNSDNDFISKSIYTYDNQGNIIECNSYNLLNSDSILTNKDIFQYNNKGLLVKELFLGHSSSHRPYIGKIFTMDSTLSKETTEEIIEEDVSNVLDTLSLYEYQYNQYGDCIKTSSVQVIDVEGKSNTRVYNFQYDKHDNWIKKETLRFLWIEGEAKLRVTDIETRDIFYY